MTEKWLSRPAVLWAMDDAPGVLSDGLPARLRYTLAAVAWYADKEGRGAYPSAAEVARITGKSESQTRRDTAELAGLGLLLPGDPGLVKEIRADRRPNVYDLPMPRGASERTPADKPRGASERTPAESDGVHPDGPRQEATGSHTATARGRMALPHGVRPDGPEKSFKRSRKTSSSSPERFPGRGTREGQTDDDDFSETRPRPEPGNVADDPYQLALGLDWTVTEEEARQVVLMLETDPAIADPAAHLMEIIGDGGGPRLVADARRALAARQRSAEDETEAERRRQHDALNEWMREHPETEPGADPEPPW